MASADPAAEIAEFYEKHQLSPDSSTYHNAIAIAQLLEKRRDIADDRRVYIASRAVAFASMLAFMAGTMGRRYRPVRLKSTGSKEGLKELRKLELAAKALCEALAGLGAEARASLDDAVAAYNREPRDGRGVVSRYPSIFELSDAVALLVIEPGQLIERARQGVTERDASPPPTRSARYGEAVADYALREYAHFTGTPLKYSKQARGFVEDIFTIAECEDSAEHSLRRVVKILFAAD